MRHALKPPSEMTAEELAHSVEQSTGLPLPPAAASKETRLQWFVSATFLLHHQHIKDSHEANIAAANVLLQRDDSREMMPYIEQVLGRELIPHELDTRLIAR